MCVPLIANTKQTKNSVQTKNFIFDVMKNSTMVTYYDARLGTAGVYTSEGLGYTNMNVYNIYTY